jgi:hypothetical protein
VTDLECPPAEGAPTLKGELARGVNPFNLKFGAVAALLLGAGLGLFLGSWKWGVALVLGLFVALTVVHTMAHGLMGWVFERGLKLHCQGEYKRAIPWLSLSEKAGMDHYDPNGLALEALGDSRVQIADGVTDA